MLDEAGRGFPPEECLEPPEERLEPPEELLEPPEERLEPPEACLEPADEPPGPPLWPLWDERCAAET